jgi:hypothetical protein
MPPWNFPPAQLRALVMFAASLAVAFNHYALELAVRTSASPAAVLITAV